MGSNATLGTAAMNLYSAVAAFGEAPTTTPPTHSVFAESFKVS